MRGARASRPATGHLASVLVHCSFHQGQQGQTDRPPHTDRQGGTTTECSVAICSDWLVEQKEDSNGKTGPKKTLAI